MNVDLKYIERGRAQQEAQRMLDSARRSVNTLLHSHQSEAASNHVEQLCQQYSHSASSGLETGGHVLVEVLPVIYSEVDKYRPTRAELSQNKVPDFKFPQLPQQQGKVEAGSFTLGNLGSGGVIFG